MFTYLVLNQFFSTFEALSVVQDEDSADPPESFDDHSHPWVGDGSLAECLAHRHGYASDLHEGDIVPLPEQFHQSGDIGESLAVVC